MTGFEPAGPFYRSSRFPSECLKPLSHTSKRGVLARTSSIVVSVMLSATRIHKVETKKDYRNSTGPSAARPPGIKPGPRGLEALVLSLHHGRMILEFLQERKWWDLNPRCGSRRHSGFRGRCTRPDYATLPISVLRTLVPVAGIEPAHPREH